MEAHRGAQTNGNSPPSIYVDAAPLSNPRLTGIGRYTARLALALARRSKVRFFADVDELNLSPALDWSQDQDLQTWARRVWRSKRTSLDPSAANSPAIYPCMRPQARRFAQEISVLHDFTPLIVPHTHTPRTRRDFQQFFSQGLLASDSALSVSHATRADATWLCDFPPQNITVCHSGPSICVEHHVGGHAPERRPNVILVVSTLEPRKNAHFLLDWFRDTKALADGTELWWVGHIGWLTSRRRLRSYRKIKNRRVRFLGTVSDAHLCRLYQTAAVSIYPSLYEGFGFPPLDTLRHGTPVIIGYHSALREFEGLPGITYFDPCDATTLDAAWHSQRTQPSAPPPIAELNARYNWDNVAATVLSLAARPTAIPLNADCAA